ncbi:MAG: cadherin-like beta sandwich domain-containing protein [Ruminococcaceae bacterium]|nr:cadherin-like beta sandwich domain-containing protein [Oscillospiraceae bacterium]
MKKRVISLLLTVAMIVSVCCVFASAAVPSYRYYYYDKFTADIDVVADDLCCKSECGDTLTAYVDKSTDKAIIDVDITGRYGSIKVTKDGKSIPGYSNNFEVKLDEGWNTVEVTVSPYRYTYIRSPFWVYKTPVQNDKPEPRPEPETPADPKPESKPETPADPRPEPRPEPEQRPAPQRPVYFRWYPIYRTTEVTRTYTVKIYRGDAETCGHVPCAYAGCGKHGCTVHAHYDLGTVVSDTYKITAITNQGGGVSCADAKFTDNKVVSYLTVDVVSGTGAEINIVPQTGYTIDKITVDGVSVPLTLKYTFSEVTADHTIAVEFAPAK